MSAREDDRLLTPPEAAEYLRTTTGYLKQWRYRGGGPPYVKCGRKVLYQRSVLAQWIDERAVAS